MKTLILISIPALMLFSCGNSDRSRSNEVSAPVDSFPLPAIPAGLAAPEPRAAYASERFWNEAVLPDSATAGLEQAMANFGSLVAIATDTASATRAARALIARASESEKKLNAVMQVAEHYFFDPNSPVRNEELFIRLIDAAPESERLSLLREQISKNRVGTTAASFPMITTSGRRTTLAAEAAKQSRTLVYFFDTECPTCKKLIPQVAEIASGIGARVIAVAPQANSASMQKVMPLFPEEWTLAADMGEIDSDQLYFFPALPSLYLVDSSLTVLAKDIPI